LVGLFAAGLAPSGSADPFGLRRAALGVVLLLIGCEMDLDLRPLLQAALELLPAEVQPAPDAHTRLLDEVLTFIAGRQRAQLLDGGFRHDIVDAVLAEQAHNPYRAQQGAAQLAAWIARPDWPPTLAAYARCVRITRDQKETFPLDPAQLVEPAEQNLLSAFQAASAALPPSPAVDEFFAALLPMIPAISRFFDEVLVMAADPAVRANRLGLLQQIAGMAKGVADFSKLEGF
jgi:glycyl-tRNA synthetase